MTYDVDYSKVPVPHMVATVRRYVEKGCQPGHFMTALLSNDLMGAVGRADAENAAKLREWAIFLRCELPAGCHGSRERVAEWMVDRRVDQSRVATER